MLKIEPKSLWPIRKSAITQGENVLPPPQGNPFVSCDSCTLHYRIEGLDIISGTNSRIAQKSISGPYWISDPNSRIIQKSISGPYWISDPIVQILVFIYNFICLQYWTSYHYHKCIKFSPLLKGTTDRTNRIFLMCVIQ